MQVIPSWVHVPTIKLLPPKTLQATTEEYTCEPAEDLRYLCKRQDNQQVSNNWCGGLYSYLPLLLAYFWLHFAGLLSDPHQECSSFVLNGSKRNTPQACPTHWFWSLHWPLLPGDNGAKLTHQHFQKHIWRRTFKRRLDEPSAISVRYCPCLQSLWIC